MGNQVKMGELHRFNLQNSSAADSGYLMQTHHQQFAQLEQVELASKTCGGREG